MANKKENKESRMICGFCNGEIGKFKELIKVSALGRVPITVVCPHCKAILGFYKKSQ